MSSFDGGGETARLVIGEDGVVTSPGGFAGDMASDDLTATTDMTIGSSSNTANAVLLQAGGAGTGTTAALTIKNAEGISNTGAAQSIQITSNDGGIELLSGDGTAANSQIYLHANGGTDELIKIHSDQGTGAVSYTHLRAHET